MGCNTVITDQIKYILNTGPKILGKMQSDLQKNKKNNVKTYLSTLILQYVEKREINLLFLLTSVKNKNSSSIDLKS